MPALFLRKLTSSQRSTDANVQVGFALAFVAGAANAGGFLAVRQYTSHMSGVVSAIADQLALGDLTLALAGFGSLLSFMLGAACSAVLINWGRRKRLQSQYALPLLLEAALLLCFGLLGSRLALHHAMSVSATVVLLCFIMGLQNAIITKISNAEIRTTHMTGIVTDLGIELGKLFYWNSSRMDPAQPCVLANRRKLRVHGSMLAMFFLGGVAGATGFKHVGYSATVPLAGLLVTLAILPVLDDLRGRRPYKL
ncbi:YoaK family protein [Pigmentiphaga soli]|uniref:YoaK family protein n=1 Tax=Pigmentiphaga soli TaxID=1007095 RepID=A0ABP8GK51_9BURK